MPKPEKSVSVRRHKILPLFHNPIGVYIMNALRRLLAFILVLALVLPLGASATAAEIGTDSLILQLINYYRCYQEDAQTDYGLLLDEMAVQNPALAESWRGIMNFWIRLNRDMQVHEPILPDGLPDDDSLCIVVMGFYLQPDGGIRKGLCVLDQ